jgi:AcrR family transcriptional regulator
MIGSQGSAVLRRRSARSHEAVLAAATKVCAARGYSAASIEEIAAAAGVGKQTIYRWWPNKAALFIEVYGRLAPVHIVTDDTGDVVRDLRGLVARLSSLYSETAAGNILAGLIAEAQTDGALAAQLRDAYVAPRRTIVRTILERAAARGDIAMPRDSDFASDLFSGAIWFRLLLGERKLDRKFADKLIEALLHGLGRSGRGVRSSSRAPA